MPGVRGDKSGNLSAPVILYLDACRSGRGGSTMWEGILAMGALAVNVCIAVTSA